MTKGQFIDKWGLSTIDIQKQFESDLEAVIANEIAKMQEAKLKPTDQVTDQVQHELNPIEQSYHNYEAIRYKKWEKFQWIKKHSEFEAKTENGAIFNVVSLNFNTHPQLWELYTEPAEKPSSQVKLYNSFDKDRFERMFRAVVASGKNEHWEEDINVAKWAIEQLDAYYATKEGGNNG